MIIIAHHPMRLLKRERRRALIFSKYLYKMRIIAKSDVITNTRNVKSVQQQRFRVLETLAPQIFVRSLANLLVKNA